MLPVFNCNAEPEQLNDSKIKLKCRMGPTIYPTHQNNIVHCSVLTREVWLEFGLDPDPEPEPERETEPEQKQEHPEQDRRH